MEGSLERESNINVLEFFLKDVSAIVNDSGCSLLLTMLDFAPELEQSRILIENLNVYCSIVGRTADVNQIEKDWTSKLLNVLRMFNNANPQSLSIRVKDILAPLNKDFNYR